MNPSIQSLWIILTVTVPGIVSYGVFRVLVAVLGIDIPFLAILDSTESLFICVLFAIMFTLQIFGIVVESIAFRIGPYKHKNPQYQKAFNKRYEIIATMDPEKDCHIERIVAQFFMSHNIAVGMVINLCWVICYEVFVLEQFDFAAVLIIQLLLGVTLASIYIPINRFLQSCKVLHAHMEDLSDNNPHLLNTPAGSAQDERWEELCRTMVIEG